MEAPEVRGDFRVSINSILEALATPAGDSISACAPRRTGATRTPRPTSMHWVAHIDGGPRRVNHTAVVIDDAIYSFGGYCSNEDYHSDQHTIDVHLLNTQTLRWSAVPPNHHPTTGKPLVYPDVPFKRYGHTTVAYRQRVYMWGGRNDEYCCDILFCFDTRTHLWSRPAVTGRAPGVRDGHSSCLVGHCMYVFGGFEEDINQFSCDVHCLDLRTMHWTHVQTRGTPPSYRDFHTATVLNGRMYVFGGRGDRNSPFHTQEEVYCKHIMYLDLDTFEWQTPQTHGTLPLGRRSHSAFVYGGRLLVFGGYNSLYDRHFNELHSFDPASNEWSVLQTHGKRPMARRRQVCLVVGTRMFLFGGTSPTRESLRVPSSLERRLWDYNDLHVLDFEPSLKTLAMLAVLKNNLNTHILPKNVQTEIQWLTKPNMITRPNNQFG